MSAYIRVASANQNITVPQYFQQSVVSATQKNVYYMDGNVGIGQAVPTSKLVVDGSTSIGYPTTAAPTNGLIVSGSVGIGITNPTAKLEVYGNILTDNFLVRGNPGAFIGINAYYGGSPGNWRNYIGNASIGSFAIRQASDFPARLQIMTTPNTNSSTDAVLAGMLEKICITTSGYVGIGNTNPQFPLEVSNYVNTGTLASGQYYNYGGYGGFTNLSGWSISVKGTGYIWATTGLVASSDTRIKTNIQDINDETALSQLRLLQPKTYEYIDKVQRGSDPVIGFIAQEVAEVLPRAVTKQKEIIPSIYAIAAVNDGVLTLEKEHGLVVSDKVKLIKEQGSELVTTVKEVLSTMSFTVDDTIEDARIFVYGKEVPDFHTLDKNAIFTIGVAAVQELDRQVQSMKSRLGALEQKLNLLINNNNAT